MQRTEINQSITLNRGDCSVFMGPRRLTSGWSSLEVLLWGVIGFVNELIKWRGVTCPGRPVESSFLSLKGDSGACWRKFVLHQLNHRSLSSTTSLSNWYSSTFFPLLSRDYCGQVSDCCCSFAGRRSSVLNTDMTTPKNKHFFTTKGPALHFVKLLWPVSKFKSWRIILVSRAVIFFFFIGRTKTPFGSFKLLPGCVIVFVYWLHLSRMINTYLHKAFTCAWIHECLHEWRLNSGADCQQVDPSVC